MKNESNYYHGTHLIDYPLDSVQIERTVTQAVVDNFGRYHTSGFNPELSVIISGEDYTKLKGADWIVSEFGYIYVDWSQYQLNGYMSITVEARDRSEMPREV